MGPGIKHIMVFQNIEGKIVAKASNADIPQEEQFDLLDETNKQDPQKSLYSYAAVLANICHEYIEFGLDAFKEGHNKFKQILITHNDNLLVVKPIDPSDRFDNENKGAEPQSDDYHKLLILCFICDTKCNIGLINKQIKTLAEATATQMFKFTNKLTQAEEHETEDMDYIGYDPMKDPAKMNVVY